MSNLFSNSKPKRNETLAQSILLLSILAAVCHALDATSGYGELTRLALKGAPVTLLALFALVAARTGSHVALVFALAFSAVADILISTLAAHAFISGLAVFLLAHLIYTGMFFRNRDDSKLIGRKRYTVVIMLWIAGAINVIFLYPLLGQMLMPVLAYSIALLTMASMAIFSRFNTAVVGLGAILFVISDGLLAFRYFAMLPENSAMLAYEPATWTKHAVWAFYFSAQLLIASGVIFARDKAAFIRGYRI